MKTALVRQDRARQGGQAIDCAGYDPIQPRSFLLSLELLRMWVLRAVCDVRQVGEGAIVERRCQCWCWCCLGVWGYLLLLASRRQMRQSSGQSPVGITGKQGINGFSKCWIPFTT